MNDKKISFNCKPDDDSKVIFEEVCRQIGLYYKDKENFKSLKRKLRWQNDVVQLEFGFWSSHSNMRGDWVSFEIVPSIYALDNSGMEKNGLVYTLRKPINFNVCHIDSELFYKIIDAIENEIEFAQKICSKEGFSDFLEENKNRNFILRKCKIKELRMRPKYCHNDFAVYKGITFETYTNRNYYIGLLTELHAIKTNILEYAKKDFDEANKS